MSWDFWRGRVARLTEPTAAQLERVRYRLDAQLHSTAPLLREGGQAHPVQIARVRARLRAGPRPVGVPWGVPALGAMALAAAALLAFQLIPAPPTEVAIPLVGQVALSDEIHVVADGTGVAHGAGRSWTIDWEQGAVAVAVAPGTGQQVAVQTREATVRVIGTAFTVTRDALGSRVDVREGRVAVDCATGPDRELGRGETAECLPTTASGLLGRAHAQAEAGAPAGDQLASLDRALALAPDASVRAEIVAATLAPLIALDRTEAARAVADEYLRDPAAPRAAEVHRLAGRLAIGAGDCAEVVIHFTAVPDLGAEEAAWLERCTAR